MLKFIVGVLCIIPFIMGIIGVIGLGILYFRITEPAEENTTIEITIERKDKRD